MGRAISCIIKGELATIIIHVFVLYSASFMHIEYELVFVLGMIHLAVCET